MFTAAGATIPAACMQFMLKGAWPNSPSSSTVSGAVYVAIAFPEMGPGGPLLVADLPLLEPPELNEGYFLGSTSGAVRVLNLLTSSNLASA